MESERPVSLQAYLYQQIPLSQAMAVVVLEASPQRIVLQAPLAPNINHRHTVFGGSASAVAILAAWALVHTRLMVDGREARVIIQRNTMDYERPIAGPFTASADVTDVEGWDRFVRTLARRGRARVVVSSLLEADGLAAGRLEGVFVAFAGPLD